MKKFCLLANVIFLLSWISAVAVMVVSTEWPLSRPNVRFALKVGTYAGAVELLLSMSFQFLSKRSSFKLLLCLVFLGNLCFVMGFYVVLEIWAAV